MRTGYVSIIGRPNSGKSTLMNRILGEDLAIVTHKAQTTRNRIVGIHNMDGAQIIFLDTPGLHKSEKPLNIYMNEQVDRAIQEADVVCWVVDASSPKTEDVKMLEGKKTVIVVNKIDLVLGKPWESVVAEFQKNFPIAEIIAISARSGHGVDGLLSIIKTLLPEAEALYPDDQYTEHPVRFLAAEIIREQIMLNMHQEIPYSVAVEIEDYREEPNIHKIHAAIIVEKDSQKGMVVGKGGAMIKKVGELSRAKIEKMVGSKVFLKLFVKVEKNWTKDPAKIKDFIG